MPLEELAVFKSNYAANRKQDHISYINTFKDIFLITLFFFSDNILQRNLINTFRETWVQRANMQGACARSAPRAPRQPLPTTEPRQEGHAGPFPGAAQPSDHSSRSALGQPGKEGKFPG